MFRLTVIYASVMLAMPALSAGAQQPASIAGKPAIHKTAAQARPARSSAPAPAAAQASPQPAALPTPEEGPSSPPQVTFQGGQLTIEARNSTMSDVLNAVKQKTGAAVDMPAVSSERVVGRFGPGAPRDVIAQLLNGSHFDYVLLGSPADPGALKKIVLMARAAGPEPAPQQQQASQENHSPQAVPQVDNEPDTEVTAPDQSEINQPPDDESQQPDQNLQQEGQPPNGPVVKTPEQLLRELQQQQQQQQQQNPPQQ